MRAEIVDDEAGLQRLEEPWWELWRRLPHRSAFTSPAWLVPWWSVFAPGALRTVAVWEHDRLVGLAPLYREEGPYGRRLLPLGIGISDDSDILIAPDRPEAGSLIAESLDAMVDWDEWSAEELGPQAAGLALDALARWTTTVAPQSACPVLPLPSAVDGLAPTIPPRKLRKWRMAQNRAARRDARIERISEPSGLDDALAILFRLHGARWEARHEPGVLADARVQRFHHLSAPRLLAAGLLRLSLLHIDGAAAGVFYGFGTPARADAYLGGFDPAFGFESPGTVLLGDALEQAMAEGARSFHFLRGQEAYKYEWGATDRWNSRRSFARQP